MEEAELTEIPEAEVMEEREEWTTERTLGAKIGAKKEDSQHRK